MDKSTHNVERGGSSQVTWTVPIDLVATAVFVVLVDTVLFMTGSTATSLRAVVAFPLVLFVPGYVLIATLFPARDERHHRPGSKNANGTTTSIGHPRRAVGTIDWRERIALSFGLSLAVVPLLGLVIGTATGSLSRESVLVGLNLFVLLTTIAAGLRRYQLSEVERLRLPIQTWIVTLRRALGGTNSRVNRGSTIVLMVVIVAAAGMFGWALLAPQSGETYTSATLLAENGDGELVASGYPTTLRQGSGEEFVLRVENHEAVASTYTVVGQLQRVEPDSRAMTVTETERVFQDQQTVDAGDQWATAHTVTPSLTGENLRLVYYIYRGDVPAEPDGETAYRTLYVWVDVDAPGGEPAGATVTGVGQ
jgi:uncharacterized membrane protein